MLPALGFMVAMTLAGTLLPLALVHSCGQVWGLALGAAALSYFFRTRPACRHC